MIRALLFFVATSAIGVAFTPETLTFKVTVDVDYRCYARIPSKTCDNKNYKKTLFSKPVTITIKSEDTPDGPQYVGDWIDKQIFKGKHFEYAITIFKEFPKNAKPYYTLRAVLSDGEENRSTSVTLTATSVKEFNAVTLDRNTIGQPEVMSKMTVEFGR